MPDVNTYFTSVNFFLILSINPLFVNKNKKDNTSKNNTKLPQTGAESITVIAIIALGSIAISSYISYRRYKNI